MRFTQIKWILCAFSWQIILIKRENNELYQTVYAKANQIGSQSNIMKNSKSIRLDFHRLFFGLVNFR